MFRCALHGTICASTASDQVILAHKVSQNPINCVKILCHGCQAMKTSLPPPSKAVLGSDQHGNAGLLQCENTSHTAFLTLAGLLITVSTKVTQALVELSAWRWLENILQIYLYVYWEQLENLESFVTTFSLFFFLSRIFCCQQDEYVWVGASERTKLLRFHHVFSKFVIFLCLFFFRFDKSILGYGKFTEKKYFHLYLWLFWLRVEPQGRSWRGLWLTGSHGGGVIKVSTFQSTQCRKCPRPQSRGEFACLPSPTTFHTSL